MIEDGFFFDKNEFIGKSTINKGYRFIADPCLLCGLFKKCLKPKMIPFGNNKKRILVLGEAPGKDEDVVGIQFVGRSGKFLNTTLSDFGISMDKDCLRTNVQQCFVEGNIFLPDKVQFCYDRLDEQIKKAKPKLILCFGQEAAKRIIEDSVVPGLTKDAFGLVQGDVYPSRRYNCWVSFNYHPAYVLRNDDLLEVFYIGIERGLSYLDLKLPALMVDNDKTHNHYVTGEKAVRVIESFGKSKTSVSIDYETNQVSPFLGNPELLLISLSNTPYEGFVIPLKPKDANIWKVLSSFLKSNTPKTAHNAKFEELWTRVGFGHSINNIEFDTILSAHIIDERRNKKSLDYLSFAQTGESYKGIVDNKNMEEEIKHNFENVVKYSSLDARYPVLIRENHKEILKRDNLEFPMQFLMAGNEALADMEYNGVKVDLPYFEEFKNASVKKSDITYKQLLDNDFIYEYEKKYHRRIDLNSSPELGKLIFKIMGLEPLSFTAIKKDPQVDQAVFEFYKNDENYGQFFTSLMEYKHLQKLLSTSIGAIEKFADSNGFIHSTYSLFIAETFRSSSREPNLQNVPTRDEGMKEFRKVFVPRYDYFLELDFKGADISAIAMESGDRVLTKQINDNVDIHKYWATGLFQLPEGEITKSMRSNTKNGAVFPWFYGSYYKNVALNLGLSERHVRGIENEFWSMYNEVARWIKEEKKKYQENGYVTNALGFRRRAPLSQNQIVPSIIQGDMFLGFLLDTMIRAKKQFKKYKIKSLQVMQVHDSLTIDAKEDELNNVIDILEECAINKTWKWCEGVKLNVDWAIGENWLDMSPL